MANREPFRYGIVLLPDVETCVDAVIVNRRLAGFADTTPIVLGLSDEMRQRALDNSVALAIARTAGLSLEREIPGSWPHITLVQKAVRPEHLGRLVEAVGDAIKSLNLNEVSGGFTHYAAWGRYLFRMVAPQQQVTALHLATATAAASVDADCKMPLPDDLGELDIEEWNVYGWLHAGRNYKPHLTVSRARDGAIEDAVKLLPGSRTPGPITGYWSSRRIGIGRLGPHGTVPDLIATMSLSGLLVR